MAVRDVFETAVVILADRVGEIGDSDCEELGEGWLVQPVNAITSFAYVVVGLGVLGDGFRRHRATVDTWVFAVLLAAVGLGSVAFHGPQPGGARVMHDLPILLVVLYIVARDIELLRSHPSRWTLFVPAAVVATGVTLISVDVGTALTGIGVIAVAGLEAVIYRRRLRGPDDRRRRRSALVVISVAAIAGATWLLGRTDSPACDPDGGFQFHGLWHVLSAAVFGLWWWIASVPATGHDDDAPADLSSSVPSTPPT